MKTLCSKELIGCFNSVLLQEIPTSADFELDKLELTQAQAQSLAHSIAQTFDVPDFDLVLFGRALTLGDIQKTIDTRIAVRDEIFDILSKMNTDGKLEKPITLATKLNFSYEQYFALSFHISNHFGLPDFSEKTINSCGCVESVYRIVSKMVEAKNVLFEVISDSMFITDKKNLSMADDLKNDLGLDSMDRYDLANWLELKFALPYFSDRDILNWGAIKDVFKSLLYSSAASKIVKLKLL